MDSATFNKMKMRQRLPQDQIRLLIHASTLRPNERNVLVAFVTAAEREYSYPAVPAWLAMDYWPSTEAVSAEAGVCVRTARTTIRRLAALGVLVPKHRANANVPGFGNRRPVTYGLNLRALKPRSGDELTRN